MKIIDKSAYTCSKDNPPFCNAPPGDVLVVDVLDITVADVGFAS